MERVARIELATFSLGSSMFLLLNSGLCEKRDRIWPCQIKSLGMARKTDCAIPAASKPYCSLLKNSRRIRS